VSDLVELLEWDSEFFGCTIARVTSAGATDLEAACRAARGKDVDCLYLLVDGHAHDTLTAAARVGFSCMGDRLTFRRDLLHVQSTEFEAQFAPTTSEDLEHFIPHVRTAFQDSRFFRDPRFDRERAESLYEVWLRKSALNGYADACLTAFLGEQPVGFVTVDVDDRHDRKTGTIGLIGVTPSARGRGVGRALVAAAHQFYRIADATCAEVVTHGTNLAAQRLYLRDGYRPAKIQTWFHWWSD
jgi:dTDP-4-amino-4,6-dideoxy-D-galactose acyltransferase